MGGIVEITNQFYDLKDIEQNRTQIRVTNAAGTTIHTENTCF